MHQLVILYRQFDNRTGNPRRDGNNVSIHLPIAGPGIIQVIPKHLGHDPDCNTDRDQSYGDLYDLPR